VKARNILLFVIAAFFSFVIVGYMSGLQEESDDAPGGVPDTSASAVTFAPSSMDGINTHSHVFGTGADPGMITLGPKAGGQPDWPAYATKTSMEFELGHGGPVLAPIDMILIGFDNRNAEYRAGEDERIQVPYNDLELCFESESPEWSNMIICTYHLLSSPLLLGHNLNTDCSEIEEWQETRQAKGHLYSPNNDYNTEQGDTDACDALLGYSVKRGQLIGYAGSVGNHSMASFRFKVQHTTINPTVQKGNIYLHWVQPGSFFYWKCYTPNTTYPKGVLAYPFICENYQLPTEQYNPNYKYTKTEN
jgi:hypothetical protein